jgi:hypothetical protein
MNIRDRSNVSGLAGVTGNAVQHEKVAPGEARTSKEA